MTHQSVIKGISGSPFVIYKTPIQIKSKLIEFLPILELNSNNSKISQKQNFLPKSLRIRASPRLSNFLLS